MAALTRSLKYSFPPTAYAVSMLSKHQCRRGRSLQESCATHESQDSHRRITVREGGITLSGKF